jgi:sugar lactone lactonase YvrE
MRPPPTIAIAFLGCTLAAAPCRTEEPLYVATPLTAGGAFTEGIEGPACDRDGNVYAVNLARQHTVGRVTPAGKANVFVTLPEGSTGNGICFDRAGAMYIADYTGHNVLRVDLATKAISVYAHDGGMSQPNDLAIAPDGTIYASDPSWSAGTGQLWRLPPGGKLERLATGLGTTNGIEVSPDGSTLYVNESVQLGLWAFPITKEGLGARRLVRQFPDHGFDGMRADVDGNLYITRYGKGVVAIVSPAGEVLREVDVLGKKPSNLCFGGPDGRTVYVTEVEHRRLVRFRVERPGLSWLRWQERPSALEQDPRGWVDLMPPADFKGWRRVVLPTDPPSPHDPWSLSPDGRTLRCSVRGVRIKEMLLHEVERGDNIFHVEWRFVGGPKREYNGGLYVRTGRDGVPWLQAQIAEQGKPPGVGDLFADVAGPDGKPKRVEILSALPGRAAPPGEWNTFEVTCRGKSVTLWVNGAVTARWDDCPWPRGHLGLQAEFYDLEFRNLKVKSLD